MADWFREATCSALAEHLAREGWTIERESDTAARERGIDLLARRDGRRLAVEVKGNPASTYARGPKAGQPKPTVPTLQARHWFSGALFSVITTKETA